MRHLTGEFFYFWCPIHSGKYAKYQMSEKDYIFGAITLYNDMINLFIYVLKMLGEEDH